jgi:nucleosome binding factor SPN SPT16 subunit
LIINPSDQIKQAYSLLFSLVQTASSLQKSSSLSSLSTKLKLAAKEKDSDLCSHLDCHFGYGSKGKTIEEGSKEVAVPGEVFTFSLILTGINVNDGFKCREKFVSLVLIETFFVLEVGPAKCLTEIVKEYQDISYSLEDETKTPVKIDLSELETRGILRSSRLRNQVNSEQLEKDQKRKERQYELRSEKYEELKTRFAGYEGEYRKGVVHQRSLAEISSYPNQESFPELSKRNQVFIDTRHDSLLVPIQGQVVPFHASTIKNVSKNEEGKFTFLRINFIFPGSGLMKDSKYVLPELTQPRSYYVKELTFRSTNSRNLNNSFKTLKELIKKVRSLEISEKEKSHFSEQEKLVLIKGKRPTLSDVTIRPNISGKKTQGCLEGHSNGVRFTSNKNDKVDIIFSNIKHAIFQPVENELIVLIHFRLRNSVLVGGKKTQDVQFFTEAGVVSDDLDMRRRSGMDLDEVQAEQRERKFKEKLNKEFKNFVESVQAISNESLDFDIPYRELGFYGVPYKSNVFIMPSVNCLLSLIDQPFFVASLNDIEIAHFERVQFNLKNFDLVLIFKDYSTTPMRICTIPAEYLEPIKDWLNDIDIVYSESLNPLNWSNVMKEITKDIHNFIEEGGWNFLQDSEDEESLDDDEGTDNQDSEFSDSECDESSEEDYSEEESEAEESDLEASDLSDDSGLDWEEHEALAKKMDQRKEKLPARSSKKMKK